MVKIQLRTKSYVDEKTSHHTSNLYHLRQSFDFYDSHFIKIELSTDNIIRLLSDYNYGYHKIQNTGDYSVMRYCKFIMRNDLPKSTYSALFFLHGYSNDSLLTGRDLGPILFEVKGINCDILKYGDDNDSVQTKNHVKGNIWFTVDGVCGFEIELRFFDKSITHFVVLSRCVEGKVNLGFSTNIFNVAHNDSGTFYFEDINMNSRKIKNLGDPTGDGDGTNKKYVDTENAKQDIAIADKTDKSYVDGEIGKVNIDTTPLLPRDGSRSMFGDLDMDGNHILYVENLNDYKDDDSLEVRHKDLRSVVNKGYLNERFLKKDKHDNNFDLRGDIIRNCEPYYDGLFTTNDLVSKAYVDTNYQNPIQMS